MESKVLARAEADPTIDDEASLVKATRSDPAAFSALYRRYVTPVYRYLYKWLGNPNDAEDLTSQVFTEVLEGLADYKEQGSFAAWLFTIARRKAIGAYRRRNPTLPLDAADQVPESIEDPLEQVVLGRCSLSWTKTSASCCVCASLPD